MDFKETALGRLATSIRRLPSGLLMRHFRRLLRGIGFMPAIFSASFTASLLTRSSLILLNAFISRRIPGCVSILLQSDFKVRDPRLSSAALLARHFDRPPVAGLEEPTLDRRAVLKPPVRLFESEPEVADRAGRALNGDTG